MMWNSVAATRQIHPNGWECNGYMIFRNEGKKNSFSGNEKFVNQPICSLILSLLGRSTILHIVEQKTTEDNVVNERISPFLSVQVDAAMQFSYQRWTHWLPNASERKFWLYRPSNACHVDSNRLISIVRQTKSSTDLSLIYASIKRTNILSRNGPKCVQNDFSFCFGCDFHAEINPTLFSQMNVRRHSAEAYSRTSSKNAQSR